MIRLHLLMFLMFFNTCMAYVNMILYVFGRHDTVNLIFCLAMLNNMFMILIFIRDISKLIEEGVLKP